MPLITDICLLLEGLECAQGGWLHLPQPMGKASPISARDCCPDSQFLGLSVESLHEGFAWYLNTSGMYLQQAPQDLRQMRERDVLSSSCFGESR